jgi:hypothetical protein
MRPWIPLPTGRRCTKLRRVSAVLGLPAEAAVIERLEFVVSGVFCREHENGGRERNADKLRRLPVAPLQKTWVECGASFVDRKDRLINELGNARDLNRVSE